MNVAPERAREACASCRKSHKKCIYNDNSTRCSRCEKRNTTCSLFLSVETTAVDQQGPMALEATGSATSAPDSWDGTPHNSAAPSNFPYPFPPQENYYWPTTIFTEATQGQYPAGMIFQTPFANHHESEQPAMNQDGLYDHNNVFNDHDGT